MYGISRNCRLYIHVCRIFFVKLKSPGYGWNGIIGNWHGTFRIVCNLLFANKSHSNAYCITSSLILSVLLDFYLMLFAWNLKTVEKFFLEIDWSRLTGNLWSLIWWKYKTRCNWVPQRILHKLWRNTDDCSIDIVAWNSRYRLHYNIASIFQISYGFFYLFFWFSHKRLITNGVNLKIVILLIFLFTFLPWADESIFKSSWWMTKTTKVSNWKKILSRRSLLGQKSPR